MKIESSALEHDIKFLKKLKKKIDDTLDLRGIDSVIEDLEELLKEF